MGAGVLGAVVNVLRWLKSFGSGLAIPGAIDTTSRGDGGPISRCDRLREYPPRSCAIDHGATLAWSGPAGRLVACRVTKADHPALAGPGPGEGAWRARPVPQEPISGKAAGLTCVGQIPPRDAAGCRRYLPAPGSSADPAAFVTSVPSAVVPQGAVSSSPRSIVN